MLVNKRRKEKKCLLIIILVVGLVIIMLVANQSFMNVVNQGQYQQLLEVLLPRYAYQTTTYQERSFTDVFRRVANYLGDNKGQSNSFYKLMANNCFLPNSPCLMNAGTPEPMLAACFVVPVHDNAESIMKAVNDNIKITRMGGGVGMSFHELRPRGAPLTGGGFSSGPIEFIRGIYHYLAAWAQGRKRRGAYMVTLTSDHPDIYDFIAMKNKERQQLGAIVEKLKMMNFNGSLTRIINDLLSINGGLYMFNESVMTYSEQFQDGYFMEQVAKNSWGANGVGGEPGVLDYDNINKYEEEPVFAVNPCSEATLLAYEACLLGSINLTKFVFNGFFDWELFDQVVRTAFIFLNNMLDKSVWPLPENRTIIRKNRKVGLGVMGFADALLLMGIRYGSEASLAFIRRMMKRMNKRVDETSDDFNYNNLKRISIAPTGSIAIIGKVVSSGIEPHFGGSYDRFVGKMDPFAEGKNKWFVYQYNHPLKDDPSFVTAHQLSWKEHLLVQAEFQKYVDLGVSKTINMPSSATVEDIIKVYQEAHRLGVKGVTIYRDMSNNYQPLQLTITPPKASKCSDGECSL